MGDQSINIAGIKATCSNITDQSSCTSNSNCEWNSTLDLKKWNPALVDPIKYCLHATDLSINFTDLKISDITPTCKYTGPDTDNGTIICAMATAAMQQEIQNQTSTIETTLKNFLQSQSYPAQDGKSSPDTIISTELLSTLNNELDKIDTMCPTQTVLGGMNCDQYIQSGQLPPLWSNCQYLESPTTQGGLGADCSGCACGAGVAPAPPQKCNIPSTPITPVPSSCNIPTILENFFNEFEPIFQDILNTEIQTQMLANFPQTINLDSVNPIKVQEVICSNWLIPKEISINNIPASCTVDAASDGCANPITGPAQITLDNSSLKITDIIWTPQTIIHFTLSLEATLHPINIDATMTINVKKVSELPGPIQPNCLGEGGCDGQYGTSGSCCAFVLLGQQTNERTAPYISASIPITLKGTFVLKNQTDLKNLGACITIDSLDISINPIFVVTKNHFSFKISNCESVLVEASAFIFDYIVAGKTSWWQDLITPIVTDLVTSKNILPLLKTGLGKFRCK
ncbi:hypothetical protein OAK19_00175 [Aureispira]|nr:hypothetical protein [Aureispira sp.]